MVKKTGEGSGASTEKYGYVRESEVQVLGRGFLFRGQESIAHLWIQARGEKLNVKRGETVG